LYPGDAKFSGARVRDGGRPRGPADLVHELRRRGYTAHDADEDGFSEPRADGRWRWRVDRVADVLGQAPETLAFFAGCSEEQVELPFDVRALLTAPRPVLIERLRADGPYVHAVVADSHSQDRIAVRRILGS
jgi:hypothetical protein